MALSNYCLYKIHDETISAVPSHGLFCQSDLFSPCGALTSDVCLCRAYCHCFL